MREAAKGADISHVTLYKMINENPGLPRRVKKAQSVAQQAAVDVVEESMYRRATNLKDPQGVTAGLAILRARRKDVYGETQGLLNNGTVINIGRLPWFRARRRQSCL